MPGLNQICRIINQSLQEGYFSNRRFNPTRFNGIADPLRTVSDDEKEVTTPTIIDNNGEGKEIVYNDQFSAQCYHRLISPVYSMPDPEYGKAGTTMQETANMKMIFMGDRSQMKQRQEEIIAAVIFDFPKEFVSAQFTPLGLTSCVIEMGDVEANMFDVFISEWNGREYDLTTSSILFAVNYKIINTYNKCFEICS